MRIRNTVGFPNLVSESSSNECPRILASDPRKFADLTQPPQPVNCPASILFDVFHKRTVPSLLPVANTLASNEKATASKELRSQFVPPDLFLRRLTSDQTPSSDGTMPSLYAFRSFSA